MGYKELVKSGTLTVRQAFESLANECEQSGDYPILRTFETFQWLKRRLPRKKKAKEPMREMTQREKAALALCKQVAESQDDNEAVILNAA